MNPYLENSFQSITKILLPVIAITLAVSTVACGQSSWRNPDALFDAMEIEKGSWVADVGSGDGDYTILMAPVVGESGRIFAVDLDEDKLDDLRRRVKDRGVTNVSPIYSVPGNPMLPRNSLDALLIRNAYHEFRNYMEMLQHLKASLKPGGRLVMAEPMEEEVIGKGREQQAEEHTIAIKFAREDLKKAGFKITKEVEQFTSNTHRSYWMIIAEKSQ